MEAEETTEEITTEEVDIETNSRDASIITKAEPSPSTDHQLVQTIVS